MRLSTGNRNAEQESWRTSAGRRAVSCLWVRAVRLGSVTVSRCPFWFYFVCSEEVAADHREGRGGSPSHLGCEVVSAYSLLKVKELIPGAHTLLGDAGVGTPGGCYPEKVPAGRMEQRQQPLAAPPVREQFPPPAFRTESCLLSLSRVSRMFLKKL